MDENRVMEAVQQDEDNQPATESNFRADCISAEGKGVRRVLTEYLDP